MNTTVARIVEIMFQDTVMDDEVQAIKDEVMNNCQERYQDMLDRGMDEDSAIAAVVDSLKGMEEVIAQYPKKNNAAAEETEQNLVFDPTAVGKVKCYLIADDVSVMPSEDGMIHVQYDKQRMPETTVELNGDVLRIARQGIIKEKVEKGFSWSGNWDTFSDLFNDLKKAIKGISINIGNTSGELILALPVNHVFDMDMHTTSGDVSVNGVNVNEIMVETTSGDVEIHLDEHLVPAQIKVKGASGDASIHANARGLHAHTVSGDVECNGNYDTVFVNTVSGDGEVNGSMRDVKLNSVSGDMALYVQGDALRMVHCNTTSGDLEIRLPAALQGQVAVQMNSMSGSKRNRFGEPVGAPMVHVQANSVSGDVTVC